MNLSFDAALAADLIAGVILAEAAWLAWRRRRTGRGPRLVELAGMLGAGFALVMALRCTVTGAPWPWVALWLVLAGAAHALDLSQRIEGRRPEA